MTGRKAFYKDGATASNSLVTTRDAIRFKLIDFVVLRWAVRFLPVLLMGT